MELALLLAEATGRRLGSIRQLRWDDVDFRQGTIRWRAEVHKKGQKWLVPMPTGFADELRAFQRRLGAVGGWVVAPAVAAAGGWKDKDTLRTCYQAPDSQKTAPQFS